MTVRFLRSLFLLGLVSFAFLSCAGPTVKTEVLGPARSPEAAKIREIAVLPFDGPNGKELARDLASTLSGVMLEEKPYFRVADPAQVEKILKEQGIQSSGTMGESDAARVGKLLGTQGIYTGVVTSVAVRNHPFTESRRVCAQSRSTYETRSKSPEENCIKWNQFSVECLRKEGIVSFTARLIHVETARVVYRTQIREDAISSTCEDRKNPPAGDMELVLRAKERAKLTFRKEVAPSYLVFDLPLMESKEGLASKEAEQKLNQGLEATKRGRLDQACDLWESGIQMAPRSPSLAYNLAVCAEAREDWKAAADLYRKAGQALGKPDDRVTWGLERVAEREKSLLRDRIK